MTQHKVASRAVWLKKRLALLKAEKELTRKSDALAIKRQELPWVKIDKEYQFDAMEGKASLADLFQGRSQLLIYHFMLGPDFAAGCPSCSSIADGFDGIATHLAHHDVMLAAVSRAPLKKIKTYKKRMGWKFPWVSSFGSDFNFDFNASQTLEQQGEGAEYNYRREPAMKTSPKGGVVGQVAAMAGVDTATFIRERPGMSAFVLEKGIIYHTYSAYARGLDGLWESTHGWIGLPGDAMKPAIGCSGMMSTGRSELLPFDDTTPRSVSSHVFSNPCLRK